MLGPHHRAFATLTSYVGTCGIEEGKGYTGRGHLYKCSHMHKEMSTRFHCRASNNSTMQKLCIFKGG